MTERWVLNASPLIALGRIDYTHLFGALAEEIAIPRAVVDEIEAGPADDRARRALANNALCIVDTVFVPEVVAWDWGGR